VSWHSDGSHCEQPEHCAARADRRQRAREAFHDGSPTIDNDAIDEVHAAAEAAIEAATRVRVDDEIIDAARVAYGNGSKHRAGLRRAIEAAFVAAGFEVEQ
jgi:hypothetical protein